MKFLDRNQYCVWFSNRCTYSCSYCCNLAGRGSPFSRLEKEGLAPLMKLLGSVEPGVIMVSGGEPALWKDAPTLIAALPQHSWVILSNLSVVPDWFYHPNVRLVISAFHPSEAAESKFSYALTRLLAASVRCIVKILVASEAETEHLASWTRLGDIAPTHLAPLNGHFTWTPEFLQRLSEGDLLTSSLYNYRFFLQDRPSRERLCVGGTRAMFQVGRAGFLSRCSTPPSGPVGTIWEPHFIEGPASCSSNCFCEWHHWAGVTYANDNETWTHFVETGEWRRPTPEQFQAFTQTMNKEKRCSP